MPPPHKFQRGDTSAPLPNRSGRYQGTTPTTWLNFNTPCKSQLKNAWPFSPTTYKKAPNTGEMYTKTNIHSPSLVCSYLSRVHSDGGLSRPSQPGYSSGALSHHLHFGNCQNHFSDLAPLRSDLCFLQDDLISPIFQ